MLMTQEALAALVYGTFYWPRELTGQRNRLTVTDWGRERELPLLGRGEGRQLDIKGVIRKAIDEGIPVYACPLWTSMLNVAEKLPEGLATLDDGELAALLGKAKGRRR